jgi:hypothetical protein
VNGNTRNNLPGGEPELQLTTTCKQLHSQLCTSLRFHQGHGLLYYIPVYTHGCCNDELHLAKEDHQVHGRP